MNLGEAYRELYEQHQALKMGHAATNHVARRLGAELEEEKNRAREQLRYILRLRRYLRDEYGICVTGFDLADSSARSEESSTGQPDLDDSSQRQSGR